MKKNLNQTYDEIYSEYYCKIAAFLSRSVGTEDAKDLAQEVFTKVFSSMSNFEFKSSIYTWIYRIAVNVLIDHVRKNKNEKKVLKCDLADRKLFFRSDSDYLTQEFKIVQDEMNECVCSYIKALPERYKTAIILREYENMRVSEIAEVMRIKTDSAKVLLKRARQKLRENLNQACNFYYNEQNNLSCEEK